MANNLEYLDNKAVNKKLHFNLDYLGVISSFFKQTGLTEFVDTILPKSRDHKITHGEAFKFLSLSAFSMYRRSFYKLSTYLSQLPLFALFRPNIDALSFNDDALAKFLEEIDEYGPQAFFLRIVQHLAPQLPHLLDFDRLHTDITNFTVYGQYEQDIDEDNPKDLIKIVYGHPKDKRSHLKCLSLALVTNSAGMPVFMKPLSGNCSDNKELNIIMREFFECIKKTLKGESGPLFISDAAFYCKKNISDFPADFITRVPETLTESRNLIFSNFTMRTMHGDPRYSFYETKSSYADLEQTWILVHSTEMAEKQTLTFERRIAKEMSVANGELKSLGKHAFACEPDARRAAESWIAKQKWCNFETLKIIKKENRISGKMGRPHKGEKLEKNFFVRGSLCFDSEVVEKERLGVGRFILATNNLSLTAEEILTYYKEQAKVEKCFRYLKGNELRISEILLKKVERIQGLCCFIALVMLIASILETTLRNNLKTRGQFITNYLGRPINKPTLKQVFEKLEGITAEIIQDSETNEYMFYIILPESDDVITILKQFGDTTLKEYAYEMKVRIPYQYISLIRENKRVRHVKEAEN
ncbi:MAG: IS1634 family transposase [Clostridiales Family XIII bacterium]|jgi:transposase|nr:IS1634 family transposase [Clostridiales Family XIII bacterium]